MQTRWFLLAIVILSPALAHSLPACTQTAAPGGPPISAFWSTAQPGAVLCLRAGTYTGASQMLAPPAGLQGTSGKPITIRAEQDGAVFIDGEYRHAPLNLQNNHWLVIEGVNVANSRQEAINVTQSTHIILRRICGWNANPPAPIGSGDNLHTMLVWDSADNLFEDLCLFGYGRNTYNDFGRSTQRNTMRRAWMRWEGWAPGNGATKPGPTLQTAYGTAQDSLYENVILVWGANQYVWGTDAANHAGMIFRDGPPSGSPGYTTAGLIIYGYDNAKLPLLPDPDGFLLSRWVPHTFRDIFVDGRSQPQASTARIFCDVQSGDGYSGGHCGLSNIDRVTTIRTPTQQLASIATVLTHGNMHDCSSLGACPNFYTGSLGSAQGARACFRYQDGTLTTTPLWPWPMDDRIKAALALAGTGALAGTAGPGYSAGTVTAEIAARYGAIPGVCLGRGMGGLPAPTRLRALVRP